MNNKKKKIIASILIAIFIAAGGIYLLTKKKKGPVFQEISVESAPYRITVPASGTVQPENKITIYSPISGRMDRILVEEGQKVKKGQIIAWMSSTDRAALMDSARSQGANAMKEWDDIYKPTPIVSPANGEIISRSIVVGQTVSQQTLLFELSDRLIVMADLDETDLGKIHLDQIADIKVDSFPGVVVTTKVIRIAQQSVLKNSINTYQVLLVADKLPKEFRAGMTATIQFIFQDKPSAMLAPTWIADGRENFTQKMQFKLADGKTEEREVKFGLSNGEKVELLEGANAGDILLVKSQSVLNDATATPFGVMGGRRR